jgi:hypothetical protein
MCHQVPLQHRKMLAAIKDRRCDPQELIFRPALPVLAWTVQRSPVRQRPVR